MVPLARKPFLMMQNLFTLFPKALNLFMKFLIGWIHTGRDKQF